LNWLAIPFAIGFLILFLGLIVAYGDACYQRGRREERERLGK
jgi:hypothetical protein